MASHRHRGRAPKAPIRRFRLVRVLQIIATLDPAGAERQMVHLCRRLNRAEYEPAVCCLTRGGPLERELRQAGVPVAILHKRGRWDLGIVGRTMQVIRRFQPQIVHTWLPTANTIGRVAAIASRTPVLIASERAKDAWKGAARRWADRALQRRTARFITNAEAVRRFLIDELHLPETKIRVVRNGLDLAEFDAAASQPPAAPLPDDAGPIIGTVGRLEPQKGVGHLIEAFAQLPPEWGAARLWIAGGGPDEPARRRQVEAAGLAARVRFLGVRSDVPALMRRFDLFVLASLWEGLPNVALEAMAARRPVVATRVDGTPEAVVEGETGLLAPPADPGALARAMTELLLDPARRRQFGDAGRRRIETEFAMTRMVERTEAIYREALAEAMPHDR